MAPSTTHPPPTDFDRIFHPKTPRHRGRLQGRASASVPASLFPCGASAIEGEIFLVNPKGGELDGETIYRSVADIPGTIDFAIVAVVARVRTRGD